MSEWILFLDDVRSPASFPSRYDAAMGPDAIADGTAMLVRWARDVDMAMVYVRALGPPKTMYLDHNLGHNAILGALPEPVSKPPA